MVQNNKTIIVERDGPKQYCYYSRKRWPKNNTAIIVERDGPKTIQLI